LKLPAGKKTKSNLNRETPNLLFLYFLEPADVGQFFRDVADLVEIIEQQAVASQVPP
jgi:hypothetical protein